MFKAFSVYIQYFVPQRLLSFFMGQLAEIRLTWLKNFFIRRFIKKYAIDLQEALISDPTHYSTFNDFFIRRLKPIVRPVTQAPFAIASPVDGTLVEFGNIHQHQLLQAKQLYFSLESLLGNDKESVQLFTNGCYATFYLAPRDYHRVHMPLSGDLIKTLYVPGRLFSVNHMTSELIPNLYGRNERLITLFHTEAGPMAVILVGAMIVGNIQTVWGDHPTRTSHIHINHYSHEVYLETGMELGYFKLGSTVILLYPHQTISWGPTLKAGARVHFGQPIGNFAKLVKKLSFS